MKNGLLFYWNFVKILLSLRPNQIIKVIEDQLKYSDIKYGIKLGNKNIGFNGKFYTFPYFLTFLLKGFLADKTRLLSFENGLDS